QQFENCTGRTTIAVPAKAGFFSTLSAWITYFKGLRRAGSTALFSSLATQASEVRSVADVLRIPNSDLQVNCQTVLRVIPCQNHFFVRNLLSFQF
ncbi:MAG: hypothetical protein C0490_20605, partial [Marivirga sp.]|nr:hypothetical protein [Marivirga sp.]